MKAAIVFISVFLLSLAVLAPSNGNASGKAIAKPNDGKLLLQRKCGRCHSVDQTSQSSLANAPALRDVYRRYPIERLAFELSEGIGSRHKDMPQIQFSSEQIDKILTYLQSISGSN